MKITAEELDKAITQSIEERVKDVLRTSLLAIDRQDYMEICGKSKEFKAILFSYIKIFGEGDKTIQSLIFNCLMTGFDIGYIIAKNREITQLEEMFQKKEE